MHGIRHGLLFNGNHFPLIIVAAVLMTSILCGRSAFWNVDGMRFLAFVLHGQLLISTSKKPFNVSRFVRARQKSQQTNSGVDITNLVSGSLIKITSSRVAR